MKRNGVGPVYWSACKVTSCEPGRDFGFAVYGGGKRLNTWRYVLEARDGGTLVTESFELAGRPCPRASTGSLLGWARGRTNEKGMRQTLERIREVAESESHSTD